METKKGFYGLREESIDKQPEEDFENLSAGLAQEVSKIKYYETWQEVRDEINKRTKSIELENAKNYAVSELDDVFSCLLHYEHSFKDYLGLVKNLSEDFSNHLGQYVYEENPIIHFLTFLGESWHYKNNLSSAKLYGADISGLPAKLNYLEHLN